VPTNTPTVTPTVTPTRTPTNTPTPVCVSGKTTGGGEIAVSTPTGFASFGFNAQSTGGASGQFEYVNHAKGLNVHGTVTSVCVFGNNAVFSGTCVENGTQACTFSVTVQDNGEPGNGVDRFTINVSGPQPESQGGIITRGNIQVH
jgi:hypothetical protein